MQCAFLPATPVAKPAAAAALRTAARRGATPVAALPRPVSVLLSALPTFFATPSAAPSAWHQTQGTPPPITITRAAPTHGRAAAGAHAALSVATATAPKFALATKPSEAVQPAAVGATSTISKRLHSPSSVSWRDRLDFYWGEYLMWHPGARVLSLLAFTLSAMYLGSFLYRFADPKKTEAAYPFWHAVRAIANPLEDDWTNNNLRAASIILASVGMVVFAILVGMVTESVESAVQAADGDNTPVVVSDHVLVCGWGSHVSQMIKDVSTVSPNLKVVVLASPDHKDKMINEMRTTLTDKQRRAVRVFYRPGAPVISDDLDRVGASRARKIVLVNSRTGLPVDADRLILSQALALRQNLPSFSGDIVAELNNARDETILRSIMDGSHASSVETVNAEQLLFRFMAQAIRQPGLADVVAQLMGDDAKSVFHVMPAKDAAPSLVGTNFADLRPTSVPGSILCGFFDKSGNLLVENGKSATAMGTTIEADTKFLLLGTCRSTGSTVQFPANTPAIVQSVGVANADNTRTRAESYLVCGWRADMQFMLQELDAVLPRGSRITIIDEDVPDSASSNLRNVRVKMVRKRADRYENLERFLGPSSKPLDHVVVLGSALGDSGAQTVHMGHEEDSKTLATLVYVNDLLSRQEASHNERNGGNGGNAPRTMVTTEFVNERVAEMARDQGNIANAILPQNLSAKIAAQTVRDSRLNAVWRELLSQRGREVYLRPVSSYPSVSGERLSFATLADNLAASTDDIVIGYVPRYVPKVKINPQEGERFNARTWDERDTLIVLSKD